MIDLMLQSRVDAASVVAGPSGPIVGIASCVDVLPAYRARLG